MHWIIFISIKPERVQRKGVATRIAEDEKFAVYIIDRTATFAWYHYNGIGSSPHWITRKISPVRSNASRRLRSFW